MSRLKKRANNRCVSQIYLGRDENGKKRYKSVYGKTPAEVKEKEVAVRPPPWGAGSADLE